MMIKTSDLQGAALDWAVAKAEGFTPNQAWAHGKVALWKGKACKYSPSTDWSQGGPIIERERIEWKYLGYETHPYWGALKFSPSKYERKALIGPTPLIAAMRTFSASKLGDEIEVPNELTGE